MSHCIICDAPVPTVECCMCAEKEKARYLAGDKRLSAEWDTEPNSGWEYDDSDERETLATMGYTHA